MELADSFPWAELEHSDALRVHNTPQVICSTSHGPDLAAPGFKHVSEKLADVYLFENAGDTRMVFESRDFGSFRFSFMSSDVLSDLMHVEWAIFVAARETYINCCKSSGQRP